MTASYKPQGGTLKETTFDRIKKVRKVLNKTKYVEFIDPVTQNDFDFGSYGRVAKKFKAKKPL